MTTPSVLHVAVDRIAALRGREVSLREAGRRLELNPMTREEAAWLFARADEVRREWMELLERCGLS